MYSRQISLNFSSILPSIYAFCWYRYNAVAMLLNAIGKENIPVIG